MKNIIVLASFFLMFGSAYAQKVVCPADKNSFSNFKPYISCYLKPKRVTGAAMSGHDLKRIDICKGETTEYGVKEKGVEVYFTNDLGAGTGTFSDWKYFIQQFYKNNKLSYKLNDWAEGCNYENKMELDYDFKTKQGTFLFQCTKTDPQFWYYANCVKK